MEFSLENYKFFLGKLQKLIDFTKQDVRLILFVLFHNSLEDKKYKFTHFKSQICQCNLTQFHIYKHN